MRVVVAITAVNRKPDLVTGGGVTRYFYDGVNLGVQPEAKRFRATQGGSAGRRRRRDSATAFRLVTVAFAREPVLRGDRQGSGSTFDLPAGAPRSDSDVRVGPAFATFMAWAFGDAGTVRVDVPEAFEVDIARRAR